ncbi:DUF3465 domain-containing protein [Moraxella osloensis]|nr:DUF3465 domain-containing protein [Moraxella osloensis]
MFVTGCSYEGNADQRPSQNQSGNSQLASPNSPLTGLKSNQQTVKNSGAYTDKKRQATNLQCNNAVINQAYQAKNPSVKRQVLGCGTVIKVLKDDNEGSRHQKFLVKIDNYPNITVLIAHNIDLAPRIEGIQANNPIRFYGEYIYNDKGGVVHWTHRDPASRHQDGWLEYKGQQYQ